MRKARACIGRFSFFEEYLEPEADTLIITYGVTSRAAKVAVRADKAVDNPVSLLILKTLWPVPEKLIREKAEKYNKIMVIEMNMGQYVREIRRLLPGKDVRFYGQMNGELIAPSQIREAV